MSQQQTAEDHYDKERRHAYHSANLQGGDQKGGETAEILRALSEINDLPIQPQDDPVMGQLVSRLTSTANLSSEEVRSNEWVREYILVLYLSKFPTDEGMHGSWRGWSHGSRSAERDPLDPERRMELEAFVTSSKLALSRSEDFTGAKEAVRNVSESIVNEEAGDSGGGGILGRLRG